MCQCRRFSERIKSVKIPLMITNYQLLLQSVEIWTSTEPKADDLRDAAESLNHARTESFHRSSRSAGMLQVMVKQIQSSIIRHSLRYPLIVTHTPYLLFIMYWEITLFATF